MLIKGVGGRVGVGVGVGCVCGGGTLPGATDALDEFSPSEVAA